MSMRFAYGKRPQQRVALGFTLFELLVALAVFAVMSVAAYGGLQTVLSAQRASAHHMARLTEVQRAFALLGRDIRQAVLRPVRDALGNVQPPLEAIFDAKTAKGRLELTHAGWRNPTHAPRSTLQRVAYQWNGRDVIRVSWNVLDRMQDAPTAELTLLTEVKGFQVRLLDAQDQWHDTWPVPGPVDGPKALPRAVELTLDVQDWRMLRRIFRVAGTGETPQNDVAGEES
jgi:general secretion pathway protein J